MRVVYDGLEPPEMARIAWLVPRTEDEAGRASGLCPFSARREMLEPDGPQQLGRDPLLAAPVRTPRVLLQSGETLAQVAHREVIRAQPRAQLVPGERHRHRGARLGARRERGDGGIGAVVAQVVDQDLPLAPGFREGRGVE